MLKVERHNYIMAKILKEQKVSTIELAQELKLSEDTIRRDLNELNDKGHACKSIWRCFSCNR